MAIVRPTARAVTLYRRIHDKLFSLPGEMLVYPAHEYGG